MNRREFLLAVPAVAALVPMVAEALVAETPAFAEGFVAMSPGVDLSIAPKEVYFLAWDTWFYEGVQVPAWMAEEPELAWISRPFDPTVIED